MRLILGVASSLWKKPSLCHCRYISTTHRAEPLRILFCGSDSFSAYSLKLLETEHRRNPDLIASIDVVCKAGKRAGRGLKTVKPVAIKKVAKELQLPLHEIPTFTGWSPPSPINLIIAVSFGLKVPPRILSYAKYGGLNVHPSLLPDLRGPAPLHHALLQGRETSGLTLQTLHPEHFDHGLILAQEEFRLPKDGMCTLPELLESISPWAALFLVRNLRNGVFIDPVGLETTAEPSHAPKLERAVAEVDWLNWSAERILRTQNAMSSLWNTIVFEDVKGERHELRINWGKFEVCKSTPINTTRTYVGRPFVDTLLGEEERRCLVQAKDGRLLSPRDITISGRPKPEDSVQTMLLLSGRKLRPSSIKKAEEVAMVALANSNADGGLLAPIPPKWLRTTPSDKLIQYHDTIR